MGLSPVYTMHISFNYMGKIVTLFVLCKIDKSANLHFFSMAQRSKLLLFGSPRVNLVKYYLYQLINGIE